MPLVPPVKFNQFKKYITTFLQKNLPDDLYYHGLHHTKDVYNCVNRICDAEGIDFENKQLLLTAALLHDSGFTRTYKNHEEAGCELAKEVLPNFEYTQEQINAIQSMIMATKIPQSPKNHFEEIMCDADLDYLGRNDFFEIGTTLRDEIVKRGIIELAEWNQLQVRFLSGHEYFTQTNLKQRKPGKDLHLTKVKELVASSDVGKR